MTSSSSETVRELLPGLAGGQPGVQSIVRVFAMLEAIADAGGVAGVSHLSAALGLPPPTIHRLVRTLVELGYARQEPSREYALGPRLVRLGEAASRLLEAWATPYLRRLANALGESANLALLDGYSVVYVAQAPGSHSMRMFTEVGHRAGVHCSAVGKAILGALPADRALAIIRATRLEAHTARTITTVEGMMRELAAIRQRGFAVDAGEQEIGVSCVAMVLPGTPPRAAVSVSGPAARMTDHLMRRAVPLLSETARLLAEQIDGPRWQGAKA